MDVWQFPAVLLVFLSYLLGPPASLGDVARREAFRRQLMPPSSKLYTNADLPLLTLEARSEVLPPDPEPASKSAAPAAATPAATGAPADAADKHDESWWRNRIGTARSALDRDQFLMDSVQTRISSLTSDWINLDDPGQKARAADERDKAVIELERLKKTIQADQKAINDILEEARRAGVPPGWLRRDSN